MIKYIKDTKRTFITQLIVLLLGFFYNIFIARTIGPYGKGIITIAYLFPFIFAIIIGLGLDEGTIYLVAQNNKRYNEIFSNTLLMWFIMSCIGIFILIYFKIFLFNKVLRNLENTHYFYIILSVPFFLFLFYSRAIFQGLNNFIKFNLSFIFHHGLNFLFGIILILKLGVLGGVTAIPISLIITFIIFEIFLLKQGKPGRVNNKLLKSGLWFGIRNKAGFLLDFINKRFDMFIVNYFIGATEVGYYAIAVSFAEIIYKLPDAVGMTLFPKVAELPRYEGDKFTAKMLSRTLFIMIVISLFLAIFIKPIIYITVGSKFYNSIIPFLILLPGIIFIGIARIIGSNFQGRGKPEYVTYLAFISVIITITLNLILIPKFGAIGAAISSTIAYFVNCIASIILFSKMCKIKISELLIIQKDALKEIKAMILG